MDGGDIGLELNGRAAASSTWELKLPVLSEHRFSKVEDLQHVSTEDTYLRPPKFFPAIDSIAIVGGTAFLVQITQDLKYDINVGLLSVLACLPSHLDVKFVWALPDDVWGQETFNAGDVPQIIDPKQSNELRRIWQQEEFQDSQDEHVFHRRERRGRHRS